MKKIIIAIIALFMLQQVHAQNGIAINTSSASPDASAMLDVSSTSQGVLIPRMTQAERNAISLPANGLLVYQTDNTPGFYYNSGTSGAPVWTALGALALNDLNDAKTTNAGKGLFIGAGAGNSSTGIDNTSIGFNSMNALTSGTGNTALGFDAGLGQTTGSNNVLIGNGVTATTVTASNELNIGNTLYGASIDNAGTARIGINNVPDVSAALDIGSTTTGLLIPRVDIADLATATPVTSPATSLLVYNTNATTGEGFYYWNGAAWTSATGAKAIDELSDAITTYSNLGFESIYLGKNAGASATSSAHTNVALGFEASNANTTGSANTAIGYHTLNTGTGNNNTAIGSKALQAGGSSSNTAIGSNALLNGGSGDNVAVGSSAGLNLTGGGAQNNVFIGAGAASNQTSGQFNIAIGRSAQLANLTGDNQLNLGGIIYGTGINSASGKVGIGNGNPTPNASAVLDITSTTAGLLIPRMTQVQRDAITTPATSLMIYQTDGTAGFYYYNGTIWRAVQDGVGAQAINDLVDAKTAATTSLYLGSVAGLSATGVDNIAVGYGALINLTSGVRNVSLGAASGNLVTTGNDNITIGRSISSAAASNNTLNIGNIIHGTGTYTATPQVTIGASTTTPNSTLTVGGSMSLPINSGTGLYTLTDTDYTYITSNAILNDASVELPSAVGRTGRIYIIKNGGTAEQELWAQVGETIDGNISIILTVNAFVHVQSNGSEWFVIAN